MQMLPFSLSSFCEFVVNGRIRKLRLRNDGKFCECVESKAGEDSIDE